MEVSSKTVFLINLFAAVALTGLLLLRFGWI